MSNLFLQKGDALDVDPNTPTLLLHGCNNSNRWGCGFAGNLSRKTMTPELRYRQAMRKEPKPTLGSVILVKESKNWIIANCITQDDIITGKPKDFVPFKYDAFQICLIKIRQWLQKQPIVYKVQMPKIGSGLARGNWSLIQSIIEKELVCFGIDVYVIIKESF